MSKDINAMTGYFWQKSEPERKGIFIIIALVSFFR